MRTNTIRTMAVAALCAVPLAVGASAAQAGGVDHDRFEQRAYTSWVDRGAVPGLLGGNVHRGVISTDDDKATPGYDHLDGRLEAWSCPAGVPVPQLYSQDDPEAPATTCTFRGARDLTFRSGTVTYGRNLSGAHITGAAVATDPTGVRAAARLPVDVTLRASGSYTTDVRVYHYIEEDGTRVTHRSSFIDRAATVSGHVGSIRVGDEASDVTESALNSQRDVFTRS